MGTGELIHLYTMYSICTMLAMKCEVNCVTVTVTSQAVYQSDMIGHLVPTLLTCKHQLRFGVVDVHNLTKCMTFVKLCSILFVKRLSNCVYCQALFVKKM